MDSSGTECIDVQKGIVLELFKWKLYGTEVLSLLAALFSIFIPIFKKLADLVFPGFYYWDLGEIRPLF